MPLYAKEHLEIPAVDILTWCYSNRHAYDQDKPIYVDCNNPTRQLSARKVWTIIRQLIAGLHANGFQKGDCVCIHSFNDLYYSPIVQGIIGAGGVFVGTNPAYTTHELNHTLKTSQAKFIIAGADVVSGITQAASNCRIPDSRIFLLSSTDEEPTSTRHSSWKTLLQHGSKDWISFNDLQTAKTTNAFLLFSSGTTGLPKAAQVSHYNLLAEHIGLYENPAHPLPHEHIRVSPLPFFHAALAPFSHVSVLRSGYSNNVMRRWDLQGWLTNVSRFGATEFVLVPPMVAAIVNHARTHPTETKRLLSSLRRGFSSAAPLDKELQVAFQGLLHWTAEFTQCWAMSETACVSCLFYAGEKDSTGSVGRFMPGVDVKLVDEEGVEVGPYNVRGELCVRGPNVVRGYLNNEEVNARDWDAEGFFHTGDVLFCDERTKLWYVVDRRKELIKVRGFQVAPSELEAVLLQHPGVLDTAVIGVKADVAGGEVPRAYVVRRQGYEGLGEEEVKEWIVRNLAKYKRLDGGVKFVQSIPKSATGKILKRVLREQVHKEMSSAKL